MGTTLTGKKIKDTYKSLVKVTDNSEAGSTGKQLSDGNGNDLGLYIDTDGVLGIGGTATVSLDISSKTDAVALPKGTDAQRATGAKGHIRYNTTDDKLEFYDTAWKHIATESYVNTEIANVIDASPDSLNTLNEIAAALNDDANFYTTITGLINAKQDSLTAGDGITIASDEVEVAVDDSTIELSASDGSGTVRVKDSGITNAKLENRYTAADTTITAAADTEIDFNDANVYSFTSSIEVDLRFENEKIGDVKTIIITDSGGTSSLTFDTGTNTVTTLNGTYDATAGAVNFIQVICTASNTFFVTISQ